jgi:hypothetical protein
VTGAFFITKSLAEKNRRCRRDTTSPIKIATPLASNGDQEMSRAFYASGIGKLWRVLSEGFGQGMHRMSR